MINKYNTMTYPQFVQSISKPGVDIIRQLSPSQAHLLHMVAGVSGEAGELLDAVKKHCIYQKKLDLVNVKEEIGDLMFYITGLLNDLGITLDECIDENRQKLEKRYSTLSYSNEQAITRADKLPTLDDKNTIQPVDEEDFSDVKIEKVCSVNDPDCESCQ